MNRITKSSVLILGLFLQSIAVGQQIKSQPGSQVGVDLVSLKSGRSIRGVITRQDSSGSVTMVVSREWLQQANPELLKKIAADEPAQQKIVAEQLQTRLKKRLETPPDEPRLVFFLKQELERADMMLARDKPLEPSQFVWLDLDRDAISKIHRATSDAQRVAIWAWSEALKGVETRDIHDLQRELKQRKIDPSAAPPDLSDRLPTKPQDDREWAARMAIVEYGLTKPLDFQGTEDVLVRAGGEAKAADLAPVLTKVLRSQVDSFLKDLSGNGRPSASAEGSGWLKTATKDADESSIRGLRATRVDVKLDGNQANVQTVFAARMPNGVWEIVWAHRESQDATKPRGDIEDRISNDPQVKQVLDTVKSFGLGADDQVRKAIRFGAATMVAQQGADAKFFEFRDRYLNHLDGPPLTWSR